MVDERSKIIIPNLYSTDHEHSQFIIKNPHKLFKKNKTGDLKSM